MDWIVGEVDTNGESMGPGHELTPDERKMLGAKRECGSSDLGGVVGQIGSGGLCHVVPVEGS